MLLPAASSKSILLSFCATNLRSFVAFNSGLVCAVIALIILFPIHLQAQEPRTDDEVIKVNTDLFTVPIHVRDKRGQAATTLTERDLSLKDEEHVTAGLVLYHGADRVAFVFALDQSGSLHDIVLQQREAALALAGRFGGASMVAVIRFAEKPSLVVPFNKEIAAARDAFRFPAQANRHTAIFDAAAAAVDAFEGLTKIRFERHIVVLLSDGLDNASTIKVNSVIQSAVSKHVSFYVIHLPLYEPRDGRLAVRPPAKGFRELAEKTGGKYFLVGDASSALAPQSDKRIDLSPVFQAIEDDLKSQYLLGFYTGEGVRDGRNHRFTISVPAGVEYQIAGLKYKRTQEFFHVVDKPKKVPK